MSLGRYIHKGDDRIMFRVVMDGQTGDGNGGDLNDNDEIKRYQDGRYVSSIESVWRLLEYEMRGIWPNVVRLPLHLDGMQVVRYTGDADMHDIAEDDGPKTKLLAWFDANAASAAGRQLLYHDFPKRFWWKKERGQPAFWQLRRTETRTIGRIFVFVSQKSPKFSNLSAMPGEGERYYLRLCLLHIPGAQSYADLRTVMGQEWPTFRGAAMALGLLENDNEWRLCMQEASEGSS